jgi:hypothetical protein
MVDRWICEGDPKGSQDSILDPYTSGLYYKCFTIVIYNYNDSGQYYKTTITIVIYDPS